MDVVLVTVKWQYAFVYLDDIVIFSQFSRNQMNHTRLVLSFLKDACATLKLEMCAFFKNTIDYHGHVNGPGRLVVVNHTSHAIRELNTAATVTELSSFLGFFNVLRQCVPNFVRIACPLLRLLKRSQAKDQGLFEGDKLNALKSVKDRLITPPVLVLPRSRVIIHWTLMPAIEGSAAF